MKRYLMLALLAATAASPALAQRGEGGFRERQPVADTPAPSRTPPQTRAPQARQQMREQRPEVRRENRGDAPRARIDNRRDANAVVGDRTRSSGTWRNAPQQRADNDRRARMSTGGARLTRPEQTRPVRTPPVQAVSPSAGQQRPVWNDRNQRRRDDRNRDDNDRDRGDRNSQNWNRDGNRNWNGDGNRRWDRDDNDRRWDNDGNRWNDRDRDGRRWDHNGWRNDKRYDWRRYREYNRHIYRPGRYYAPYGWHYGYRRFATGVYLDSMLWGSGYWLDDPWYYRLPPAYGPYRWTRYYNDVLLVDTRTGYVVDVIYSFFW